MAPSFAAIKALMVPSEGNIPHMYLDTAGKVTIGIGNLAQQCGVCLHSGVCEWDDIKGSDESGDHGGL
jgi:GH24 family phage-related lysozyme (muramidase)